jgi:hypothetical protein
MLRTRSLQDDLWAEKHAATVNGDGKRLRVVIYSTENDYTFTRPEPIECSQNPTLSLFSGTRSP